MFQHKNVYFLLFFYLISLFIHSLSPSIILFLAQGNVGWFSWQFILIVSSTPSEFNDDDEDDLQKKIFLLPQNM